MTSEYFNMHTHMNTHADIISMRINCLYVSSIRTIEKCSLAGHWRFSNSIWKIKLFTMLEKQQKNSNLV